MRPWRIPRALLLAAIRFYQRRLSPYKGFACAYRLGTGRRSCSTLGYRAVARYGVFRGLGVLQGRLDCCRESAARRRGARPAAGMRAEAGYCDCDVPCDAIHVDACDCANCVGCDDCGLFERWRSNRRRGRRGDVPGVIQPGINWSDDGPAR